MPVFDQAIAFLIFSLAAAITPGPSNVMITAAGSTLGLVRGIPCVLGTSLGMALLLFCAALGLGQLVLGHPAMLRAMNWGGATVLLWLAWRIATARPMPAAAARPVGLLGAALFQWINPKGWLVAIAAAGTFLPAHGDDRIAQAALFGALFFAAAFPSGLVWLLLGALMHRWLRDARIARLCNVVMGAALAASVAMILW